MEVAEVIDSEGLVNTERLWAGGAASLIVHTPWATLAPPLLPPILTISSLGVAAAALTAKQAPGAHPLPHAGSGAPRSGSGSETERPRATARRGA